MRDSRLDPDDAQGFMGHNLPKMTDKRLETPNEASDDDEKHDGFNVEDTTIPQTWVDFGFDAFGEFIHLVPDRENNELRCYRSISKSHEQNRRLKTTIKNVHFGYHFDSDEERNLNSFYLTGQQAETFMFFIDLMGRGRNGRIVFDWWEESGKPMMEDKRTNLEIINLEFSKPNEVRRQLQIEDAWQTPSQRMAKIEGETY